MMVFLSVSVQHNRCCDRIRCTAIFDQNRPAHGAFISGDQNVFASYLLLFGGKRLRRPVCVDYVCPGSRRRYRHAIRSGRQLSG